MDLKPDMYNTYVGPSSLVLGMATGRSREDRAIALGNELAASLPAGADRMVHFEQHCDKAGVFRQQVYAAYFVALKFATAPGAGEDR